MGRRQRKIRKKFVPLKIRKIISTHTLFVIRGRFKVVNEVRDCRREPGRSKVFCFSMQRG